MTIGIGGVVVFLFVIFLVMMAKMAKAEQRTKKPASRMVPKTQKTLIEPQQQPTMDVKDYTDTGSFRAFKDKKSKFTFQFWRDWWYERQHPATTALVNMELLNGYHKTFLVKERDGGFKYRSRKYLFDNDAKYFLIDAKMWVYDYHESFSLPIKRKIPVDKIRKTMEVSGISEVEYATNPKLLEQFANSKIAEGIMRGAEINEAFKRIFIILVIVAIIVVVHFLLYAQKSGVFDQVTGII